MKQESPASQDGGRFNVDVMVALVIGTVAGFIIGALPGMGANLATSLLLPITFSMKPVAGLVMLTAVYTSTVYGGSITAVLLHTPGTASSAATAIDGFELTKQGRGMTAVGAATIGSWIGYNEAKKRSKRPELFGKGSMEGAFAIKGRTIDVIVMLCAGTLGYCMRKTGFELSPLVLGLILSEIIENNIRRTMVLAKGNLPKYFFTRPISVFLAVLVLGTVLWPVIQEHVLPKKKKTEAAEEED